MSPMLGRLPIARALFTVTVYSQVSRNVTFLHGKATRPVALLYTPTVKTP
jgi:hypothetical protein